MDIDLVNKIKRLAIIALASDDKLVETLVLKGGNAIDLAYKQNSETMYRTSYDLDYSIEDGDFEEEISIVSERIKATLTQTFLENDFTVHDYKFLNKPKINRQGSVDFWGGYKAEFKVINKQFYDKNLGNIDRIRRESVQLNSDFSTIFELEFSKFEYIDNHKEKIYVDGFKIFVYTAEMIVFEKLRAICQQIPYYQNVIPSFSPRARARDFYDIHYIMEMIEINPNERKNIELIQNIFQAKRVPLNFIKEIKNNKSLHSDNWQSVKDTVSPIDKKHLKDFDYYFNYVLEHFENITFP